MSDDSTIYSQLSNGATKPPDQETEASKRSRVFYF